MKTVLFDMDGTLVPMNIERFATGYFTALLKKVVPHGYEPESFKRGLFSGIEAMLKNSGEKTNETVFWDIMSGYCGERIKDDIYIFDEFYKTQFPSLKSTVGYNAKASETVNALKDAGVRLVLATNPVFPMAAQRERLRWADIDYNVFSLITSYENSRRCKPDPGYFYDIMEEIGASPEDCIMIGNDAVEDGAATKAGIETFIITDCLEHGDTVNEFEHGDYDALHGFLVKKGLL